MTSNYLDTTILYCTDNSLEEQISRVCQQTLLENSRGLRIVSVSQQPIRFGDNFCIGRIGRSWLSLNKQLLLGLQNIRTKNVMIAEHDCLYSPEHIWWVPPSDEIFWYNHNCWLVQWHGTIPEYEGMYSYWPRRFALSQLVCSRDLLLKTIDRRLDLLDRHRGIMSQIKYIGEPGITAAKLEKLQKWAESGRSVYLRPLLQHFVKHLENEVAQGFSTRLPNLDIRHTTNFTGPRRGKKRRYVLPYWGKFSDFMGENQRWKEQPLKPSG